MSADPDLIALVKGWPYAVLASVGGFLGSTLRSVDRGEKIRWGRALVETFSAGFVGVLVLLLCHAYNFEGTMTGFIAGVLGWAGAPASMLILEKVVLKRLGLNKEGNNVNSTRDEPTQGDASSPNRGPDT